MLLHPVGKTEPIAHSHIEILGNRTSPGWDNYPPRWVMCMLSKRLPLRIWIQMQQFQKTKETKAHLARFSCKALRACCRCAVLNKVEKRGTTKAFDKEISESSYVTLGRNRQTWPDTFRGSDDPNKCFRSLCKCHRRRCNCVRKENIQTPYFQRKWTIRRVFAMVMNCCGYM